MVQTALSVNVSRPRLIVFIPESLPDPAAFIRQVNAIATSEGRDLFLLSTEHCQTDSIQMARMLNDSGAGVNASALFVDESTWAETLTGVFQPGDRIVCGDRRSTLSGQPASLYHTIRDDMDLPITALSADDNAARSPWRRLAVSALFWAGCAVLLVGFFTLQAAVDHAMTGAGRTLVMSLLWIVEIALIWAWSSVAR